MLGKLLNNMLTTEVEREEGTIRKQRIDGSSLPNFEAVRRYFGPAGRVVRSEQGRLVRHRRRAEQGSTVRKVKS